MNGKVIFHLNAGRRLLEDQQATLHYLQRFL